MLQPVARKTLVRQVLRSLQDYIRSNGLEPGDRLPPERELAGQLGVSRNTVREALRSLEAIGALSRRPRHGSVLQPVDFTLLAELSQFLLVRSGDDLSDLFVTRRLLEVNMLPLVVQNAREVDFEQMEKANRLMETDIKAGGLGTEGDMAFHRALLAAAGNSFLGHFGTLIQEFFRDPRSRVLAETREARRAVKVHSQLVQCLRDGDVEKAQEIMKEHMDVYLKRGVVQERPLPSNVEEVGSAPVG